ncbi:hypothetical protein CQY20_22630 [Mycolicibacterium agri]|uniref:Alpha/beta hydrolase n=1 Tax=Mycolicibacterium agri TaxID=36811 RepID=A0A2A7MUM1_MYCAG|nr:hypothetical protein CQY20_22630 [Mycolicibacterium agri]
MQFDKNAEIVGSADDVRNLAADGEITDLVVMSHGWNNDMAQARELYGSLAKQLRAVLDENLIPGLAERTIGLAGVLWPSKKFAEEDLIPGGAAAADSPIGQAEVQSAIDDLRSVFPSAADQAILDKASREVPHLEDKASAREKFVTNLLSLLDQSAQEPDDGTTDLFEVPPRELMDRLSIPAEIAPPEPPTEGGALGLAGEDDPDREGGAAGLFSTLGGFFGAAKNLLNGVTYYEMKARAGTVGERGLAPLITQILAERNGLRIHLVGHSFGGRLVTAAASSLHENSLASLTLLQAAFSHYGFAAEWTPGKAGAFRSAIVNHAVSGPILITHTGNDKAVGIAYAIASRIAGQNAAAVGDANDTYGGIGRNGAQKTSEASFGELLDVQDAYTWNAGAVHNLKADRFIKNHSDIKGKPVAYAILSAVAST